MIFAKIRFYYGSFIISFVIGFMMIPLIILFKKYRTIIRHKLSRLIIILLGGDITIVGKVDKDAQMYILNHQGIIDIITLESIYGLDLNWVAKKQLFNVFWLGHILKENDAISIDRDNPKGLIKLIRDIKNSIFKDKRPVVIFPEGTRAKKQKLLPFKQGAKIIAQKLNLKIQPIVITGSKQLLNEHLHKADNSTIKVRFMPIINVDESDPNWYNDIKENMQKEIDIEFTDNSRSR
jgi:1-acyl-sn-glycerol-3-phosphate acyltransferase